MKCFYHNDLDGHCAGALVRMYMDDDNEHYTSDDFIESDYRSLKIDGVEPGEEVIFVDYSFTETTEHYLRKLIDMSCDIIWIDHHISSINLCKENPDFDALEGIRSEKYSGAALTYMYLYNVDYEMIPEYVKLVSDYDTWKLDRPEPALFKLGMDAQDNDVDSNIWDQLSNLSYVQDDIIEDGKIIKRYLDLDLKSYRESYGFEATTQDGDIVYVVNRKSNSWIFGELIDKYVAVVSYVFDGTQYVYSVFSSDPNFDCSEFAETYGGGGHKGAAGFTSKHLVFVPIE